MEEKSSNIKLNTKDRNLNMPFEQFKQFILVWIEKTEGTLNRMKKKYIYQKKIEADTKFGAEIEIPCYYKVGSDVLDVYLEGILLQKCSTYDDLDTGHYSEVGENDSISNKIKITGDWNLTTGDNLEFIVRGEYNES